MDPIEEFQVSRSSPGTKVFSSRLAGSPSPPFAPLLGSLHQTFPLWTSLLFKASHTQKMDSHKTT